MNSSKAFETGANPSLDTAFDAVIEEVKLSAFNDATKEALLAARTAAKYVYILCGYAEKTTGRKQKRPQPKPKDSFELQPAAQRPRQPPTTGQCASESAANLQCSSNCQSSEQEERVSKSRKLGPSVAANEAHGAKACLSIPRGSAHAPKAYGCGSNQCPISSQQISPPLWRQNRIGGTQPARPSRQVQGEGRTEHTVDQHHRLPPLGLGLRTQNPAGLPVRHRQKESVERLQNKTAPSRQEPTQGALKAVMTANARAKLQTAPLLAPLGRDKQQKAAIALPQPHTLADNPRWNLATGDAILNNLSRLRHDQSSKGLPSSGVPMVRPAAQQWTIGMPVKPVLGFPESLFQASNHSRAPPAEKSMAKAGQATQFPPSGRSNVARRDTAPVGAPQQEAERLRQHLVTWVQGRTHAAAQQQEQQPHSDPAPPASRGQLQDLAHCGRLNTTCASGLATGSDSRTGAADTQLRVVRSSGGVNLTEQAARAGCKPVQPHVAGAQYRITSGHTAKAQQLHHHSKREQLGHPPSGCPIGPGTYRLVGKAPISPYVVLPALPSFKPTLQEVKHHVAERSVVNITARAGEIQSHQDQS